MKNRKITKDELRIEGAQVYPPAFEKPLKMNDSFWRVERSVIDQTDPLELRFSVYLIPPNMVNIPLSGGGIYEDIRDLKPVVTLVTLIEDYYWEDVKLESPAP